MCVLIAPHDAWTNDSVEVCSINLDCYSFTTTNSQLDLLGARVKVTSRTNSLIAEAVIYLSSEEA